jgi:hypothetical protein
MNWYDFLNATFLYNILKGKKYELSPRTITVDRITPWTTKPDILHPNYANRTNNPSSSIRGGFGPTW